MKIKIVLVFVVISFFGFSDFLSFTKSLLKESIKEGLSPILQGDKLLKFQKGILKDKNDVFNGYVIELGKILYFDPRLSGDGVASCNSCHNLSLGGTSLVLNRVDVLNLQKSSDKRPQTKKNNKNDKSDKAYKNDRDSKSEGAILNTPTIYNVIFNKRLKYDANLFVDNFDIKGQKRNSIAQAVLHSFTSKVEMNSDLEKITSLINTSREYRILFKKAYGNIAIDSDLIASALSAFVSTLNTPTRFDDFLSGDLKVLSKEEMAGLALFIEKGCVSCHNGINLGGEISTLGLKAPYKFSQITTSKGNISNQIKVPTLRDINNSAPYFHDGAFNDLDDAIYEMGRIQLGIKLNKTEIKSIRAFFNTLDGIYPEIKLPHIAR